MNARGRSFGTVLRPQKRPCNTSIGDRTMRFHNVSIFDIDWHRDSGHVLEDLIYAIRRTQSKLESLLRSATHTSSKKSEIQDQPGKFRGLLGLH